MQTDLRELVERLNTTCRKALEGAVGLCVSKTHYNVELEHFLIKIIESDASDINYILRHHELDPQVILKQLYAALDKLSQGNTATPALSSHIFRTLEAAWMVASLILHDDKVRSAAVLFALVDDDSLRGLVLETCPLLLRLSRNTYSRELAEFLNGMPESEEEVFHPSPVLPMPELSQSLTAYTRDLTALAKAGQLDPIWGRDDEVRQVMDILCRRYQNNPILVGEPGVGKTAIVEGLAQRVVKGQVPPHLQNVKVLVLDMIQLQAGASVKGQFEERLNTVLNAVKISAQPIILFIDEAHTLIGAGGTAGLGDAANLLKPALARGELRAIAATTWSEYKRYFEKDAALARRFECVKIEEPMIAEAVDMVRGITSALATHHGVTILDEAIQAVVTLSKRYLTGRQLPDKAMRLLDTAAARVALTGVVEPVALQRLTERLYLLQLEQSLLQQEPEGYIKEQRLAEIRETIVKLQEDLAHQQLQWQAQQKEKPVLIVNRKAVAQVVSDWTGVPANIVLKSDQTETYEHLLATLQQKIVGQTGALSLIARQILNYRAGLTDPHKPVGVFLLVGPSGVGKTETAQALAEVLTGQTQNLLRFNMTEFQEAHSLATLKGSPPGYVGYGRGGVLTEAVRRNPYRVILLDEFDKAHREVVDLFYQVFDKGILEDGEGVEVDFSNTLIVMTSNLCADLVTNATEPNLKALTYHIMPELSRSFPSALLSRVTVVPYRALNNIEMAEIVRHKLQLIRDRIKTQHGLELNFGEDTIEFLAKRAQRDVVQGARAIEASLNQELLPELAALLLSERPANLQLPCIHLHLTEEGQWLPKYANAA